MSHVKNVEEKVKYFQNLSQVKNTVNATNLWIGLLEDFRKKASYKGKIQDIEDVNILNDQLSAYIASMTKKDGSEYSVSSVKAGYAAINRFLQKNSKIVNVDLYNDSRFLTVKNVADGKVKYLT